jgi:ferrous iron transport protein B
VKHHPRAATLKPQCLTLHRVDVLPRDIPTPHGNAEPSAVPLGSAGYRPNARTIGIGVWQRIAEFLKKAGRVIVVVSGLVWLLSVLPLRNLETSYLANAGRLLVPFGAWMCLDWRMIVALLTSVVAKENTIATLGVLYQLNGLRTLAAAITRAAALAFLAIQVTFVPCVATMAAIHQEAGSWKRTAFSVGLLLVISLAGGVVVYQVGRWF